MNKFIISGNITKDIDLKISAGGKTYAKFTVAVKRRFDREKSDFFNVTAFGKQAENVGNFLGKGSKVIVEGEVQIDSKDGKYFTNVIADSVEFLDSKKKEEGAAQPNKEKRYTADPSAPFKGYPFEADIDSSDLPF